MVTEKKYNSIHLRFKYTDSNGKRKRVEFIIPEWQFENNYIICEKKASWLNNNNWYGSIIICNENPEQLNTIYSNIINYKIAEINSIIEYQKKILKKLKRKQKKNIYYGK